MEATIVELRYKTKNILKALERKEKVKILYHGKLKGTITPAGKKPTSKVKEHPFFGMSQKNNQTVDEAMRQLRQPRYHDL